MSLRAPAKTAVWVLWALLVAAATAVFGPAWLDPATRQPLSFNHARHGKMGCSICHRGVETRPDATLPDIGVCLNCHVAPPVSAQGEVASWNAAAKTKHIVWKKVTRLAAHVYFSHRRHVGLAQLACPTCHGEISARTTPPHRPLKAISMDACLDCHRSRKATEDCARCHK